MACNVLVRKMAYKFYCPTMKNVTHKLLQRATGIMSHEKTPLHSDITASSPAWTTKNPDLPLPGNIGVDLDSLPAAVDKPGPRLPPHETLAGALLHLHDEHARKNEIVNQFMSATSNDPISPNIPGTGLEEGTCLTDTYSSDRVECKVEACPATLKKSFQRLFEIKDAAEDLTVLTISQKTENDMATWSDEVEEEREVLLGTFIENAMEITQTLKDLGYWADFIDPGSGLPFHGGYKNEVLVETDDRFNQLGFTIEDLGCCKAISHKEWGTHVFVGVLVTNAPIDSGIFGTGIFCS